MKLLSEANGNKSSARVAMMICVISACVCAILGVWLKSELLGLAALVSGMISSSMGFKAYQKGKEK